MLMDFNNPVVNYNNKKIEYKKELMSNKSLSN